MSKYTTEVRFICENAAGYNESKGYLSVDSVIQTAVPSIFSFDFPIFDEEYRSVLCSKILRHYYTREIWLETVGLWKLKLETKLLEIMPYYNQLYKSELFKFNPLYDTDLQTTRVGDKNEETTKQENKFGTSNSSDTKNETVDYNKTGSGVEGENKNGANNADTSSQTVEVNKGTKDSNSSEDGNSNKTGVNANNYSENEGNLHYDLYSDTPQGALVGVDDEEYLTNARKVTDSRNKNGKNDQTNAENDTYSRTGASSEETETESNNLSQGNSQTRYNEDTQRTVLSNENSKNTVTGDTNRSSNTLENISGRDMLNSTESYVLHVVGKQANTGSYSKMLTEFRETFLNIDMRIINDLGELFMNLW